MQRLFEHQGWDWQPDKCPADKYFIEWLLDEGSVSTVLFHMGTGNHHAVGYTCSDLGILCLGVTASLEEFRSRKHFNQLYQVYLADIYLLDPRLLPKFSVMTLFHLGEMVDHFGEINTSSIKRLITSSVSKEGLVFFYTRSSAWDRASKVVEQFEEEKIFKAHGAYKDLLIYKV